MKHSFQVKVGIYLPGIYLHSAKTHTHTQGVERTFQGADSHEGVPHSPESKGAIKKSIKDVSKKHLMSETDTRSSEWLQQSFAFFKKPRRFFRVIPDVNESESFSSK